MDPSADTKLRSMGAMNTIMDAVSEVQRLSQRELELLEIVHKVVDVYEKEGAIGRYVRLTGIQFEEDLTWFSFGICTKRDEFSPLFAIARPSGGFCHVMTPEGDKQEIDSVPGVEVFVIKRIREHLTLLRGLTVADRCRIPQIEALRDRLK